MLLTLKNIGKIDDASIEIKGITIIAGENNTGKSTLGKALFCVFNSFYKIEQHIYDERKDAIESILESFYHNTTNRFTRRFSLDELADNILHKKESYAYDNDNIKELLSEIEEFYLKSDRNFSKNIDNSYIDEIKNKLIPLLNISDDEIFQTVLQKKLESEFNGQINSVYNEDETGSIYLRIKNYDIKVIINNNEITQITNNVNLNTEVIYIDDPFALDDLRIFPYSFYSGNYLPHKDHLKLKLRIGSSESTVQEALNEIITSKKIKSIVDKINIVCNGEMVRTTRTSYGYQAEKSNKVLDIKNISTGLKSFVILKTLLVNGSIEYNGTIIMDEPEIHLHPEWQLIFAELIVLMQKEFNLHILLNTHSPYFLNAIEVYAAKHEIADKCKYYLTENVGKKSKITDVSNNIEMIYAKLARPLQDLENERYFCD